MQNNIRELAKLLRYYSLVSTTQAGSGHPSSCLSAADLMAVLMYGNYFRFDLSNPDHINNDRLIFSKGHAAPLFYSLWAVAGQPINRHATESEQIKRAMDPEEMLTLRKFGSRLEGHPTMEFPFTEIPTGSLGQGLSVGVGMALNAKMSAKGGSGSAGDKLSYRTFVLLGDSEMAEGSNWEAMAAASYYHLNNLVAILDVNRLGQRGETMSGHDVLAYQKKAEAFGWETVTINGHDYDEIAQAFEWAAAPTTPSSPSGESTPSQAGGDKPKIIIAKTLKGKGVSFMEDKDGWHGKALTADELKIALEELGNIDRNIVGVISKPAEIPISNFQFPNKVQNSNVIITKYDKPTATRRAYGNALVNIIEAYPNAIVLDAETSNSTYSEFVKKKHPEKFVECFIAEQNMAGMALGFARRGKLPFVSTFAAFLSRAFDQIRMAQYADANIKICGSHAGVSIGEDGSSQMGLEEIAMFRSVMGSVVLYPCDAVSTEKLVWEAAKHKGMVYIQTTRKETTILYSSKYPAFAEASAGRQVASSKEEGGLINHEFKIGGSCVLRSSDKDQATVIGAGITVHEALAAHEELKKEGINIRVIDLYSIKPLDIATLEKAAKETKAIITVEDNHPEGGIYEAVAGALASVKSLSSYKVQSLAVKKMPHSGKPDELLAYEEIDGNAIIKAVKKVVSSKL